MSKDYGLQIEGVRRVGNALKVTVDIWVYRTNDKVFDVSTCSHDEYEDYEGLTAVEVASLIFDEEKCHLADLDHKRLSDYLKGQSK